MYEINDVKYVMNEAEPVYCLACLSSNRKLTNVEQVAGYTDILSTISNNSIKIYTKLLLCWECVAMLRRIKLFKLRIEQAQRLLASHFAQKQKQGIRSLSRLTTTTNDNIIFITHTDDDSGDNKQTLTAIKQEINNFDDDCNFDQGDAPNDCGLEEIKKETKLQIKCVKRNKVTHYKIVYGQNVYKKSSLRKKFSIKEEEVTLWLERERDSKFYKSFKYRCKMCFHGYNCKEKLKKHHMECHDMSLGEYVCRWCAARFATAVSLSAHAHAHMFARACARCGFQCYSARLLNAHLDTHRLVKCVYCELCVPDVRAFNQHYKALHGVFLCDHCGKRCRTKYMLEKHMARHTTSHRCSECGRQYRSRAALNKHRALKHSAAAPEDAYCVRCDKQFDSAPVYRRHVQNTSAHAHETHKLYVHNNKHRALKHSAAAPEDAYCVRCDKQFDSAPVYRRHVQNTSAHAHETHKLYVHNNKHRALKHSAAAPEDAYCVRCDKQFDSAPVYRRHVQNTSAHAHETHKLYVHNNKHRALKHSAAAPEDAYCVRCDKQFDSAPVYRRHVQNTSAHAHETHKLYVHNNKHRALKHSAAAPEDAYCVRCDKQFDSAPVYRRHVQNTSAHAHETHKLYVHNNKHRALKHSAAAPEDAYCVRCDKQFDSAPVYRRHVQNTSAHAHETHKLYVHNNKHRALKHSAAAPEDAYCVRCDKQFDSAPVYRRHVQNTSAHAHETHKLYVHNNKHRALKHSAAAPEDAYCVRCDKQFDSAPVYRRHVQNTSAHAHETHKLYVHNNKHRALKHSAAAPEDAYCVRCDKQFDSAPVYRRHVQNTSAHAHETHKLYVHNNKHRALKHSAAAPEDAYCVRCDKQFDSAPVYRRHVQNTSAHAHETHKLYVHNNKHRALKHSAAAPEDAYCVRCDKQFDSAPVYRRHVQNTSAHAHETHKLYVHNNKHRALKHSAAAPEDAYCVRCDKQFDSAPVYRRHVQNTSAHAHETHKLYVHNNKHRALKHSAAAPEDAYCVRCDKQFDSAPVYRRHVQNTSAHAHETHKLYVHNNKHRALKHSAAAPEDAYCVRCDKQFDSAPVYRRHVQNTSAHAHETHKLYVHNNKHRALKHSAAAPEDAYCVRCDKQFDSAPVYRRHVQNTSAHAHETHKLYVHNNKHRALKHSAAAPEDAYCVRCDKQFDSAPVYRRHVQNTSAHAHETHKLYVHNNKHRALKHSAAAPEDAYCVRCDKQFDSAPVYRRHVQNTSAHAHETHKLLKKKVECPECGNTYSRRAYMMNHYRHVHMNQSKHYCAPCDRHFLNRTRYVDHMRFNHEGVKREKNKLCNVCGRGFATNRILLNHIRTHSGERPFECEYCGAKFTQKHSMLSHVQYVHLKSKRRAAWHH